MKSAAVVALALIESAEAFQAPAMRSRPVQMFEEGDIGVLPPLGVYDPLGLIERRDMRLRYRAIVYRLAQPARGAHDDAHVATLHRHQPCQIRHPRLRSVSRERRRQGR